MAIDPCSSGIQNQTLRIQVVNFQKAGCSHHLLHFHLSFPGMPAPASREDLGLTRSRARHMKSSSAHLHQPACKFESYIFFQSHLLISCSLQGNLKFVIHSWLRY